MLYNTKRKKVTKIKKNYNSVLGLLENECETVLKENCKKWGKRKEKVFETKKNHFLVLADKLISIKWIQIFFPFILYLFYVFINSAWSFKRFFLLVYLSICLMEEEFLKPMLSVEDNIQNQIFSRIFYTFLYLQWTISLYSLYFIFKYIFLDHRMFVLLKKKPHK
jgi:hypothetical protein